MTNKEMSDFLNSLWCWSRCTDEEQRKLSEIADYLSNRGNKNSDGANEVLDKIRAEIDEHIKYNMKMNYMGIVSGLALAKNVIDKYRVESESQESENKECLI